MGNPLITTRPSSQADADFVNNLTRAVMRGYVEATWHSEREREAYYQRNAFDWKSTKIIQDGAVDIGRISVKEFPDHILFDEIHLLPDYQGRGIGTLLLQDVLTQAKGRQLPVRLILLRSNPAKRLYERLGFTAHDEDAERYYMQAAV